jgi:uncharacterized protein (DUF1015 family)
VLHPVGPAVFVYRLAKGDLVATGLVVDVSVAAYDSGLIRRHEETIPKIQSKMADHFREVRINGNPVALAHRPDPDVDAIIESHTERDPDVAFVAADGFAHSLWAVEGPKAWELCSLFTDVLYITDGHHRMAAASQMAAEENTPDLHVPCALFSSSELRLRAFGRCVSDPGIDPAEIIDSLAAHHDLLEVSEVEARPTGRHKYGVKLGERWFRLRLDPEAVPDDLYAGLDVNLLQSLILEPLFGITDEGRDDRLHFVPDRRDREVECDAWFLPYPASVAEVMAVADAGLTMPPKSTWFAPKVPSGLVVRMLDDAPTG